jgi:glyoxylase-like metal-dependent hydrolase (beta-lactamase superfamily II)
MSAKGFASTGDMAEKTITFSEIGPDIYAFTAEGDPNTAVIVGDDGCIVFDAQATPAMAKSVIERVKTVTDKPIKYVVLSHYHAVRVLGASAYKAQGIVASSETQRLIVERGKQDWDSEYGRFPRLFRDAESIPGLTWPTITFDTGMTLYLGKREVQLMHLGAGHTSGDIVAWVPDAQVMCSGDLIEYHSACYCGDALLREWPAYMSGFGNSFETRGAGAARCRIGRNSPQNTACLRRLLYAEQLSGSPFTAPRRQHQRALLALSHPPDCAYGEALSGSPSPRRAAPTSARPIASG